MRSIGCFASGCICRPYRAWINRQTCFHGLAPVARFLSPLPGLVRGSGAGSVVAKAMTDEGGTRAPGGRSDYRTCSQVRAKRKMVSSAMWGPMSWRPTGSSVPLSLATVPAGTLMAQTPARLALMV